MKVTVLLVTAAIAIVAAVFTYLNFDQPVAKCKTSATATPYCMYKGQIKSVYVNEKGLILIGLYESLNKEEALAVGFDLKTVNYFAYQMSADNGAFAEAILSLSQAAIDDGNQVEMHARETLNGTIKIDRIWLLND